MTATSPPPGNGPWPELHPPPHWRVLDFISDLHLQATEPDTFGAWQCYMASTTADAVFILGDLFEVWVGDDVLDAAPDHSPDNAFEQACVAVIAATARTRPVYFMHGNRDFLVGTALAQHCQLQLLADPTVLPFGGQRWLLAHGDALCLDDTAYMAFRAQVRQPAWQQAFLAKPLAERRAIARALREQSAQAQRSAATNQPYGDVHPQAVADLLAATGTTTLLHGHTHLPAIHDLGHGRQRVVLSDWDAAATPPRAEVLRLTAGNPGTALQVQRLPVA